MTVQVSGTSLTAVTSAGEMLRRKKAKLRVGMRRPDDPQPAARPKP